MMASGCDTRAQWPRTVLRLVVLPLSVGGCPADRPVLPSLPAGSGTTGSGGVSTSTGGSSSTASVDSGTMATTSVSSTSTTLDPDEGTSSSSGAEVCTLLDGACNAPDGPWWNEAWSHRRQVMITSPLGTPLTDAVVPVRLEPSFEFACAQPEGIDLRFVDDAGAVFPHEIDQWEPGQGAIAWVRVSTLEPAGQTLWLYYGNPGAPEPAGEVWPASLGLQAVLHMGGDLDDARGLHPGRTALDGAMPQFVSDGVLGRAIHYEAILVNARAQLEGSSFIDDALVAGAGLTITAWVRSTPNVASAGPYRAVVSRGSQHWAAILEDGNGSFEFAPPVFATFLSRCNVAVDPDCLGIVDGNGTDLLTGAVPVIDAPVVPQWHHVAMVHERLADGQTYVKRVYVDGMLDVELAPAPSFPWESIPLDDSPITIGAGPVDPSFSVFHGEIDEVHLASAAWEVERVEAEYRFASDPALVSLSSPECI
ncbi:MAG: DUF2341 domain-containing protein [Myxococcota bacterium]